MMLAVLREPGEALGVLPDVLPEPRERAEEPGLAAARAGDAAAFELLYRKHVGRVYALCMRMTGNRGQAEELTQEAFIRAWEKLHTFRGDSSFSTWLHRLTVNVVLGSLRKQKRWRDFFSDEEDAEAGMALPPPPRTGERLDLEMALTKLPAGARAVFVLHDVEGYQHGEIADMLGTAPGTSKAQLHRARRLLREILSS